jgi:hypothetical protein
MPFLDVCLHPLVSLHSYPHHIMRFSLIALSALLLASGIAAAKTPPTKLQIGKLPSKLDSSVRFRVSPPTNSTHACFFLSKLTQPSIEQRYW